MVSSESSGAASGEWKRSLDTEGRPSWLCSVRLLASDLPARCAARGGGGRGEGGGALGGGGGLGGSKGGHDLDDLPDHNTCGRGGGGTHVSRGRSASTEMARTPPAAKPPVIVERIPAAGARVATVARDATCVENKMATERK